MEVRHEIQVVGASLADIEDALGTPVARRPDAEVPLADAGTLRVEDVSRSSGFDATTVILTGIVSVATSTSSALLIEYLKSRLFKRGGASKPNVTILIDGKELTVSASAAP